MVRAPHILFAGGGTGGHVYPAIAIADAVRRLVPDAVIDFAGTRDRMEWEAVPRAGYPIHGITISGFHRGQPLRNVTLPLKLIRAMLESRKLVRRLGPDVAVGTGGYVSGPVLLAADLMGTPIVIQEQNAHAGWTNRILGKRASRIHIAFEEARKGFPSNRCAYSGNPTRNALLDVDMQAGKAFYDIPNEAFVVAVLGGSLGSRAINDALTAHVDELLADEEVHLIWQSGRRYVEELQSRVPDRPRMHLLEYIDRMDMTYAAADLAVCRAGAITCSELMVTGTPSVLIPSPNVAEDHQTHNARSMEKAGASVLIPEHEMGDDLVPTIRRLKEDRDRLDRMATAGRNIARPGAADAIAADVLRLAGVELDGTEASDACTARTNE